MRTSNCSAGVAGLIAAAGLLPASVPAANNDATLAVDTSAALEEIVVTARGREEDLQNVPDSIAAFTRDDIAARQLRSAEDFAQLTPGVLMVRDQDPGTNVITVRGVSANRNQAASIAYVIDGVALADSEFFTADLFGIERVEILKGPQGALYGKNAIGGVFNIVTIAPSTEPIAQVEVGYGNGDRISADGLVSGSIGGGRVRALLAGSYRDQDGYIDNSTLGREADYFRSTNARLRVMADLTDALSLDLRANYMDEDGGAAWAAPLDAAGQTGGKLDPDLLDGPISDFLGSSNREWRGVSATIQLETRYGTLTSTSGYDDYSKYWEGDLDGTPFPIIQPVSQPIDLEIFTQELRFTSPGSDRFRWIAGVFYQDVNRERLDYLSRALPVPDVLYSQDAQQSAAFVQASYDLTPKLEVTAALRYDRDEREEIASIPADGIQIRALDATFDRWQPKVSISYDLSDHHMLYASYAEGFKTGGFNPPPGPTDAFEDVYGPEETKSYEVGAKTLWLDGRLTANGSVYWADYTDKQEFVLTPTLSQSTFNVPEVDIKGLEVQMSYRATDALRLDASYGYIDTEMKDFRTSNFLGPRDYSGNKTTYTPPYSLNVGAQFDTPVAASGLDLSARVDYMQVGKTYWEVDNVLYSPAHGWVDARVSIGGKRWRLSAWGKNITDERWATSAFGQGQVAVLNLLGFDEYFINTGAQYGATVAFKFGDGS
jgi:iron complex outermembrane receptor protein